MRPFPFDQEDLGEFLDPEKVEEKICPNGYSKQMVMLSNNLQSDPCLLLSWKVTLKIIRGYSLMTALKLARKFCLPLQNPR